MKGNKSKIGVGIDERDMIFQEITVYDHKGVSKGSFYAALITANVLHGSSRMSLARRSRNWQPKN
jgi:hypothetical protein